MVKHINVYDEKAINFNDIDRVFGDSGKYKFASIKIGQIVEYRESINMKPVHYLSRKIHEHAKKTNKKFKTFSFRVKGDRVLRVLRIK